MYINQQYSPHANLLNKKHVEISYMLLTFSKNPGRQCFSLFTHWDLKDHRGVL